MDWYFGSLASEVLSLPHREPRTNVPPTKLDIPGACTPVQMIELNGVEQGPKKWKHQGYNRTEDPDFESVK